MSNVEFKISFIKMISLKSSCVLLFSSLLVVVHTNKAEVTGTGEKSSATEPPRTYYIAAVVEYKPEGTPWDLTPTELIGKNLENYKNLILNGSECVNIHNLNQKADIIVFPEYGLTTLGIPRDRESAKPFLLKVPENGINPCDEKLGSIEVQELSCSAKNANMYVVINLGEIRPCVLKKAKCPTDGVFQFNTNVVFDRTGTIVGKYEKANLYFEDQFDKPNPIQHITFTTDFGVEFGLFTCYDIIFYDPVIKLVERGIKNFIFPTAWVDELPFLTAIQAQATWAYSSNSNLLASGYHQPQGGQLGSGIYSGKNGALTYTFDTESGTQLKLAEVPIDPTKSGQLFVSNKNCVKPQNRSVNCVTKSYQSFLREDLTNYTTKILPFSKNISNSKICTSNSFCCNIEYEFDYSLNISTSSENYRIIAFNGTRTVAAKTSEYDWQICGVIRCLNETLESCTENDNTSSELTLPNFKTFELTSTDFEMGIREFLPGFNSLDINFDLISNDYFKIETDIENNLMRLTGKLLNSVNVKTVAMINKLFEIKK